MNIVLVGFSTTGKSTTGRILADQLDWKLVDTDAEIERRTGRRVQDIFAEQGEPAFRAIEREVVADLATRDRTIVSTGGGVVVDPVNREVLRRRGFVVLLDAHPDTIIARLRREVEAGSVRPLLAGGDPAAKIRALKVQRQAAYAEAAHWTVHTDVLTPLEVAHAIREAYDRLAGRLQASPPAPAGDSPASAGEPAATVRAPGGTYPIYVGHGILDQLGDRIRAAGIQGRCWVLADRNVLGHAERAVASLQAAGIAHNLLPVDSGEVQKNLALASSLWDALLSRRMERRDAIVAIGGGVLGDTAGFVAATVLRGVALVHVPTTLLAMVDSSIGGKTGINHSVGKNLIGAFYQPKLVVTDVQVLETLPERERVAGWAEVIKHALIADRDLLRDLETHADEARSLSAEWAAPLIGRSAAIKAHVVTVDERETGLRMTLNYGHTIGHAIEQVCGYGTYLHGEAVAIGMRAAARLSRVCGLLTPAEETRQGAILERYGLPTVANASAARVLAGLQFDKKVRAGTVRWILLDGIGAARVTSDVPAEAVVEAVQLVTTQP